MTLKEAIKIIEQLYSVAYQDYNDENDKHQKDIVDALAYAKQSLEKQMTINPTEDVQEVRHGKFVSELIEKPDWRGIMQNYYQPNSCSCCHTALSGEENYCPNCGAKMDLK